MARPMPASPQAISSMTIGTEMPGRVGEDRGHEIERVQPDSGGFLDDRPRGLLPLVPLVGGGPHHVLGEVVDPLLQLALVLVEGVRKVGSCR